MSEKFLVTVEQLSFVPDLIAIREFTKQLSEKLKADAAFKAKFDADPRSVLNDAGVTLDLQSEILTEAGIGGLRADCTGVSCIITKCTISIL